MLAIARVLSELGRIESSVGEIGVASRLGSRRCQARLGRCRRAARLFGYLGGCSPQCDGSGSISFLSFAAVQFARAIKNLTLAEEHLHDHFPGYPVMPASLIIEGLAQTGGILVGEAGGFAEKVVLAKIPRAEFYGVACAGDQLIYEVTLTDLRSEGAVVACKAFLDGELLADAEIVFAHLDNSRANQIFGPKNFVFTQQLARRARPGQGAAARPRGRLRGRRHGRVERTAPRCAVDSLIPPFSEERRSGTPDDSGTDVQDVCEKFECCIKFMPPLLPFEAIIVERFDGQRLPGRDDDCDLPRRNSTSASCLVPNAEWS